MRIKKLGIIGGMGPEATVNLFQTIVSRTLVSCDQDHLEVVIHNNSRIPDRTGAILHHGLSPVPELQRSVSLLSACKVDLIIIPCMTSHYFFKEIQSVTEIPVMNAIVETAKFISDLQPKISQVGLLATSGTISSGLFQKELDKEGIHCIIPDADEQQHLVMDAIYGSTGIKAGYCDGPPQNKLIKAAKRLVTKGAESIIAGCTEVPLALKGNDVSVPLIDPVEILALNSIRFCGGRVRTVED